MSNQPFDKFKIDPEQSRMGQSSDKFKVDPDQSRMSQQPLGQGLNALIPPKQNNHQAQLENRINHKINETVSNYPTELVNQQPLENLREDFQKDFEKDLKEEDNSTERIPAGVYPQLQWGAGMTEEHAGMIEKGIPAFAGMTEPKAEKIFQIETEKIRPNPYQPRHIFTEESLRELADSIREFGILQPLLVTRIEKETERGTEVEYQLIASERRLMAAKMIGLPTVPVIIRLPLEDKKKLELALIENIQREDLSVISKAKAFNKLITEFGLTQQELATRIGKSREVIANTLRLLQLSSDIQKALDEGLINEGHARAMLLFTNPDKRRLFFKEILSKNLSGREALDLAQRYLQLEGRPQAIISKRRPNLSIDPQDIEWKEKLEEYFQMPVLIKKKGNQGAIEIKFFSEQDFDTILKKLLSS